MERITTMEIVDEKKEEIVRLTSLRNQYMQQGKTVEEAAVLRHLAALTEEVYGYESDENIKILNELGGTLKYIGAFEEAVDALVKAGKLIGSRYGNDNVSYATCSLNLAEVYRFMKEMEKAEELYLRTLSIYEENNLQKDYLYAGFCNNFGLFCQETGKYEKAIELHERSRAILEENPEYTLQYATTLSNMVFPYMQVGNRKKSEEYLEKSLSLIERTVGKGHSLYSASLNNLAIQYYNNGDFENALKYFEESAEICMQAFGKDSSSYRSLLQNIEIVRERLGK